MSSSSLKHYDEHLESSSGSELCDEDFLACQNSEPETRSRHQGRKSNKAGKNFYNKIKENREKTDDIISLKTEKKDNTKNIKVLQQNVIKLTEECKKLGIYIGELDTKEESFDFRATDDLEEEVSHKSKFEDTKNPGDKQSSSHTKFNKQRVGGGTGNTKCHKKNAKKQQMIVLQKSVQHLETLLQEHQTQEKKNKRD